MSQISTVLLAFLLFLLSLTIMGLRIGHKLDLPIDPLSAFRAGLT
jgi:hypothetical protein